VRGAVPHQRAGRLHDVPLPVSEGWRSVRTQRLDFTRGEPVLGEVAAISDATSAGMHFLPAWTERMETTQFAWSHSTAETSTSTASGIPTSHA
jgi:hypothetical protein